MHDCALFKVYNDWCCDGKAQMGRTALNLRHTVGCLCFCPAVHGRKMAENWTQKWGSTNTDPYDRKWGPSPPPTKSPASDAHAVSQKLCHFI